MRARDLLDLDIEELKVKEEDIIEELFNLRFRAAASEIENPLRLRTLRRDLARVKTILRKKIQLLSPSENQI